MNVQPYTVLLIEDNADDVFLMKRALKKGNIDIPLQVVQDGQAAVDYLSGTGEYADRARFPLPSLIFLDLKLPYLNGFEVLEWLRKEPSIKDLNVVILTSSFEDRDRARAAELGVREYMVKPPEPAMLAKVLQTLQGRDPAG